MPITLDRRPKGTYPFEVFHTSSRSIYRQKLGPKGFNRLGRFPREIKTDSMPLMQGQKRLPILSVFSKFSVLEGDSELQQGKQSLSEARKYNTWCNGSEFLGNANRVSRTAS
jgi:hypothetical protein